MTLRDANMAHSLHFDIVSRLEAGRRSLLLAGAVVCFLCFPRLLLGADEVVLVLESTQSEYVIREPLKFTVHFVNRSDEPVNIVDIGLLDMNMSNLVLEVTTPHDEVQIRRFSYVSSDQIFYPWYSGEPLEPGGSLQTALYPNVTGVVDEERTGIWSGRHEVTFPRRGRYEVRVGYYVWQTAPKLWRPEEEYLFSNAVTLHFRDPTPVEEEILDAYWKLGGTWISTGDHNPFCRYDTDALRNVIDKYPDNEMTKYAYFGLARELARVRLNVDLQRMRSAIPIFETLLTRYPGLRGDEMRHHLARTYYNTGEREKAIEIFNNALKESPGLEDNYEFMKNKLVAETMSSQALSVWMRKRARGGWEREEQ